MDPSKASQFRCAVLMPPARIGWWHEWLARQRHGQWIVAPECDGGEHPANAFDAKLLVVTPEAMPWAREQLTRMAPSPTPVIVVADGLRAASLRTLLRLGVRDFLFRPCSKEELELRLWNLRNVARGADFGGSDPGDRHPLLSRLIGTSEVFTRQVELIPVMAKCDAGVLIMGETGTGKEVFAQSIHYLSARAGHPWVAVNCAALPTELMEAELFGHTRGAYTSANESRAGLVAEAEGGTLFLDEVDSLPLAVQAKLLRFLQDKEYRVVGSAKARRANVRIIAASNTELEDLVRGGRFRQDLYYRLNVLPMRLPPLRERIEDLPALAAQMIARYARDLGRPVRGVSSEALVRLASHDWPGNVRELEHTLERAVLLCKGELVAAGDLDLPEPKGGTKAHETFKAAKARMVASFERLYIERMLMLCEGNITHAAHASAKNRRAFWQLIRKHRIDAARYQVREGD